MAWRRASAGAGQRPCGSTVEPVSACRRASRRTTAWPDSHKIVVGDGTDVSRRQRHERRGSAQRCHEFNLDAVRLIDLDDSAEIASPELVLSGLRPPTRARNRLIARRSAPIAG